MNDMNMVHSNISNISVALTSEQSTDNDTELCYTGPALENVPSKWMQIFLSHLYLVTSFLSLCGNLTVIVVQLYGNKSNQNIRKYLINLALSDLIIGVLCVPFNYSDVVLGHWDYPHWLCPTVQYVQPLCVFVTSVTLSLIGLERYVCALHPLSSMCKFLQSNINRTTLLFIWLAGLLYSYAIFGHTETREYVKDDNKVYYDCIYSSELNPQQRRILIAANFTLSFLCPFGLLTFSYLAILRMLLNSQQRDNQSVKETANIEPVQNRLNAIRMLLMVTVLYSVCWMPIKIYQILLEFGILGFCTKDEYYALISVYILCHWLAMANSFVNPIVYASMNASFRNDFCKISRSIYFYLYSLSVRLS